MIKFKEEKINVIIQIGLTIAFLFYFYSVYRQNTNNASNLSLLILFLFCGFAQPEYKNKIVAFLPKINSICFMIWMIIIVIQLFI